MVREKPAVDTVHHKTHEMRGASPSPHYRNICTRTRSCVPRRHAPGAYLLVRIPKKDCLGKSRSQNSPLKQCDDDYLFRHPSLTILSPLSRFLSAPTESESRERARAERRVCIIASARRRRLSFCAFRGARSTPRKATSRRQAALHDVVEEERKPFSLLYLRARRAATTIPSLCLFFSLCAPSPRPKHGPFLNPPRPTLLLFFPLLFFHSAVGGGKNCGAASRGWVRESHSSNVCNPPRRSNSCGLERVCVCGRHMAI